jgi:hypothetical protein
MRGARVCRVSPEIVKLLDVLPTIDNPLYDLRDDYGVAIS